MKSNLLLLTAWFISALLYGQAEETQVITDVKEIILYAQGAQVTRTKSLNLPAGVTTLKIDQITASLDPRTITIGFTQGVKILTIQHVLDYLTAQQQPEAIEKLRTAIQKNQESIAMEKLNLSILQEQLSFLQNNKQVSNNAGFQFAQLGSVYQFYQEQMEKIIRAQATSQVKIKKYEAEISNYHAELEQLTHTDKKPVSNIKVKVQAKQNIQCDLTLSYFTPNANWIPYYDIRCTDITKPLAIDYKARVRQYTDEEWKHCRVVLSNATPVNNNLLPVQTINYLGAHPNVNPAKKNFNEVSGKVINSYTKEGVGLACVQVEGTSIGTYCDPDGKFTLMVPSMNSMLKVTSVETMPKTFSINSKFMALEVDPGGQLLDQVSIIEYTVPLIKTDNTSQGKTVTSDDLKNLSTTNINSIAAGISNKESEFNVRGSRSGNITKFIELPDIRPDFEFLIEYPVSIPSENTFTTIDLTTYDVECEYTYTCVPRLDKHVYLTVNMINAPELHLLQGEGNIYFENTYTGKTIIGMVEPGDTMRISLGAEKNIQVTRTLVKNLKSKTLLSTKASTFTHWKTEIKNVKPFLVKLKLRDQVPVSTQKEIQVDIQNISDGKLDTSSGMLEWEVALSPQESKSINLAYAVSYPKNRMVQVE